MRNQEVAKIFFNIASLIESDKKDFRQIAYERAALALEGLDEDVEEIYLDKGLAGLEEESRRPHHSPRAISEEVKNRVIAVKRAKKTLGAQRLKEMYQLPCSEKAIRNIWRAKCLLVRRRKSSISRVRLS